MTSLRVTVVHTGLEMTMPELVFARDKTVGEVKENLHRRTGTAPSHMELWVVDGLDHRRELLEDDARLLGAVFPPEAEGGGMKLHVVDTDASSLSANTALLDGDVPKYEAKHGNKGFAEFRVKKRLSAEGSVAPPAPTAKTGMAEAAELDEGDEVVMLKDGLAGTIRYIGKCAAAAPGFFVGVELVEPKGRHDGTVKGKKLFDCQPGHGVLVRPFAVRSATHSDQREEI